MAAVRMPWLDARLPSLSFEGFAVVSRLGQAVRYAEPFDEAAREQMDKDLGDAIEVEDDAGPNERDAAHLRADMNAAMLTISPAAVGEVLMVTGFTFRSKYAPLPLTTDGSDPGHVFHPGHNMIITAVEQNLRATIDARMQEQYSATWMDTRLDSSLVNEWVARRSDAIARGESPLGLIQYSNFMELKDIVIQRQHWREVFGAVFKKKEHFATGMDRLHPIRLPLAHSRPIGNRPAVSSYFRGRTYFACPWCRHFRKPMTECLVDPSEVAFDINCRERAGIQGAVGGILEKVWRSL